MMLNYEIKAKGSQTAILLDGEELAVTDGADQYERAAYIMLALRSHEPLRAALKDTCSVIGEALIDNLAFAERETVEMIHQIGVEAVREAS